MSSVVWLTSEILENTKNVILAIHEHFSPGQRSNTSFKNRGLFHVPHPIVSPFRCLSIVEVNVIMSDN